jgi:hypothetical protein
VNALCIVCTRHELAQPAPLDVVWLCTRHAPADSGGLRNVFAFCIFCADPFPIPRGDTVVPKQLTHSLGTIRCDAPTRSFLSHALNNALSILY